MYLYILCTRACARAHTHTHTGRSYLLPAVVVSLFFFKFFVSFFLNTQDAATYYQQVKRVLEPDQFREFSGTIVLKSAPLHAHTHTHTHTHTHPKFSGTIVLKSAPLHAHAHTHTHPKFSGTIVPKSAP
jgi:hypothetical protein